MKLVFKPFAIFSIHIGYKMILNPGTSRHKPAAVQLECDGGDEKQ